MTRAPELPPSRRLRLPGRGQLDVRIDGNGGPAIVLLHGWTVSADLTWFACHRSLAGRYRVVSFDHRGHGAGLRPDDRFTLEDCADDAVAVADALGIGRFVAVGYSMGGCVTQLLARDHPDRVAGTVLCATSCTFRGRGLGRARFALLRPVAATARRVPPGLRERIFAELLDHRVGTADLDDWAVAEIAKGDPQALLDAGTALYDFDSTGWIDTVGVPTAVVSTELDRSVPPEHQHHLATALPHATLHPVLGGHTVCVGRPDRFVPILHQAIESVLGRSTGPSSTSGPPAAIIQSRTAMARQAP